MGSVQDCKVKCPKCGERKGIYELETRSNEEWFACQACGWGFETTARRFGQDLLSELKKTLTELTAMNWTVNVDQLLTKIVGECIKNGWSREDETVTNLTALLGRTFSGRTQADWASVVDLSRVYALYAMKDGKRIYDSVEKAPELVKIPLSELRPIEELIDYLCEAENETVDHIASKRRKPDSAETVN
jgi:hypothetical protein